MFSPKIKAQIINFAVISSILNFFFLGNWANLFGEGVFNDSSVNSTPPFATYVAALMMIFLPALILTIVLGWSEHCKLKKLTYLFWAALGATLIFPLNFVRIETGLFQKFPFMSRIAHALVQYFENGFYLVGFILGGLILIGVLRYGKILMRLVRVVGLILLPFLVCTQISLGTLAWKQGYYSPVADNIAKTTAHKGKLKILWLIFDELDQRIVFESPLTQGKLPELDYFKNTALYFNQAYAPAEYTVNSIPSLLSGHRVFQPLNYITSFDISFSVSDRIENLRWTTLPNLFRQSRELGYKTGLVGWYHGYCRLFARDLDYCRRLPQTRKGYKETVFGNAKEFIKRATGIDQQKELWGQFNANEMIETTETLLRRGGLDVLFVHFPFPHAPQVYTDASLVTNTYKEFNPSFYLDNLKMVDFSLGKIRRTIEKSGSWEDTVIIISSDHQWRIAMLLDGNYSLKVPFLVKFLDNPGQELNFPISTIHTKDFILAVLNKQIKNSQEAADWFHEKNQNFPVGSVKMPFEKEVEYYQKLKKQEVNPILHSSVIQPKEKVSKN